MKGYALLLAALSGIASAHRHHDLIRKNAVKVLKHTSINKHGEEITTTLKIQQPEICGTATSYSGYFSADGKNDYFFWFFESRAQPSTDPSVMWLTGGPGCSSQLALLAENGPCTVNEWATGTDLNPYSWNSNANVFWVDQPPGTGFSTGVPDTTEDEIAEDMYAFLQNFMKHYEGYFNNGFHVFGESYAGHYVPAISYHIFEMNNAGQNPNIPLESFAIGNGLTDPYIQYAYYADMAYDSGTAPSVISEFTYNIMKKHIPKCQEYIQACQSGSSSDCTTAMDYCEIWEMEPVTATGVNPYDLRIPCEIPGLCYNFTSVDTWLNNATVQAALGVDMKWEECANAPHIALSGDWMLEYQEKIPPMLAGGIRGLIYAGDVDWICNWLGNKAWATTLDWQYQSEFESAPDQPWKPQGTEYGLLREYKNFAFLQVYQAGHMVPMDQPEAALLMLNNWIRGTLSA